MFSGGPSVLPSVGPYKSRKCSNSRLHEGNSLKYGESMDYDMTINRLDFGCHRSKVEVTTGPNMGKNSVFGP